MPGLDLQEAGQEATNELPEKDWAGWGRWCNSAFTAAKNDREQYEDHWERFYRMYHSFVDRTRTDWRSRVFMPIPFYVIETITPKLVAQLPGFTVYPIGEEDVESAAAMQRLLKWATAASGSGAGEGTVYEELVKAFKSALKYGTGMLKVYNKEMRAPVARKKPQMQDVRIPVNNGPLMDPSMGQALTGPDGSPVMDQQMVSIGQIQTGYTVEPSMELRYAGGCVEWISNFDFWVAPEATSVDDARYVIHRTIKDMAYVRARVKDGTYDLHGNDLTEWSQENSDAHKKLLREIGIETMSDATRRPVEILEFHTQDNKVICWLNRDLVVRIDDNPYWHQEKPFVRIVDYLNEGEFWGTGEIETVEGLVDLYNAIVNTRIDNIKLVLNSMFAVNIDHVFDQSDLVMRPGGIIRMREPGLPVNQVVQRIELGDVTPRAFEEAQVTQTMIELTTGVSNYTAGNDSPSMNDTATGVSLITEQGNTRFTLKMAVNELGGFKRLARQFASLMQQYMPEDMIIRVMGDDGQTVMQITQESILGSFDVDIESESSAQTESMRRQQSLGLLQVFGSVVDPATGMPVVDLKKLSRDVLRTFDIKDPDAYLTPEQPPQPQEPPTGPPGAAGAPPGPPLGQIPPPQMQ